MGFVTSVRGAAPRPGLWRLIPHEKGFSFFTHTDITASTSCTQRLLECSRVCGANEISQRSHQLCCQPQKCLFITRTVPPLPCHSVAHSQGQLCCLTFDFDPIRPFSSIFCLWPWKMQHSAGKKSPACWSSHRASKLLMVVNGEEKATLYFSKARKVSCEIVLPSTLAPPLKLASELLWP